MFLKKAEPSRGNQMNASKDLLKQKPPRTHGEYVPHNIGHGPKSQPWIDGIDAVRHNSHHGGSKPITGIELQDTTFGHL